MNQVLLIKHNLKLLGIMVALFTATTLQAQPGYYLQIKSPAALKSFFNYSPDRLPFISAHRGGARPGFPENCLATFENTLRHTPALIEVDPRYTKDSVMVLLHDATLDRTTTGHGRVADFNYADLQKLHLKDTEGKVTNYRIPTLDEALAWAKGKTVIILDKKNIPIAARVKKIQAHKAEAWAMVMAYNYEEARQSFLISPDIMMEVFVPTPEKLTEFDNSGVPWQNTVAFIAHAKATDKNLYQLLHQKGVMCIIGSSRLYDKEFAQGRTSVYQEIIDEGADIIEADLAIEAGQELKKLWPGKSSKSKYFALAPDNR